MLALKNPLERAVQLLRADLGMEAAANRQYGGLCWHLAQGAKQVAIHADDHGNVRRWRTEILTEGDVGEPITEEPDGVRGSLLRGWVATRDDSYPHESDTAQTGDKDSGAFRP